MTSFHVRHDFTPSLTRDALLLLGMAPAGSGEDLTVRARGHGLGLGRLHSPDKVVASLRDLGFVERSSARGKGGIQLTPLGRSLAELGVRDELLFAEMIHLRYSLLWSPEMGGQPFAWAYRTVAGGMWDGAPMHMNVDRLAASTIALAERAFSLDTISFSTSSVLGVFHWLRALSPPCITDNTFRRRVSCPPEALVIALEGMQHAIGRSLEVPIRLDDSARLYASRIALVDENAFDEILAEAEGTLGVVHRFGNGGDMVLIRESPLPGLVGTRYE